MRRAFFSFFVFSFFAASAQAIQPSQADHDLMAALAMRDLNGLNLAIESGANVNLPIALSQLERLNPNSRPATATLYAGDLPPIAWYIETNTSDAIQDDLVLERLLQAGARLGQAYQVILTYQGRPWSKPVLLSPIGHAIYSKQKPIAEWLLTQGAQPVSSDTSVIAELIPAQEHSVLTQLLQFKQLQSEDALNNMLLRAIYSEDIAATQILLDNGADLHRKTEGLAPIMHALIGKKPIAFKFLQEKGGKVEFSTWDDGAKLAVSGGDIDVIEQARAALGAAFDWNYTVNQLGYGMRSNPHKVVTWLKENQSNSNIDEPTKNSAWDNLLWYAVADAASDTPVDVIKTILNQGGNPYSKQSLIRNAISHSPKHLPLLLAVAPQSEQDQHAIQYLMRQTTSYGLQPEAPAATFVAAKKGFTINADAWACYVIEELKNKRDELPLLGSRKIPPLTCPSAKSDEALFALLWSEKTAVINAIIKQNSGGRLWQTFSAHPFSIESKISFELMEKLRSNQYQTKEVTIAELAALDGRFTLVQRILQSDTKTLEKQPSLVAGLIRATLKSETENPATALQKLGLIKNKYRQALFSAYIDTPTKELLNAMLSAKIDFESKLSFDNCYYNCERTPLTHAIQKKKWQAIIEFAKVGNLAKPSDELIQFLFYNADAATITSLLQAGLKHNLEKPGANRPIQKTLLAQLVFLENSEAGILAALKQGADPYALIYHQSNLYTLLGAAAAQNHLKAVSNMLEAGADPNHRVQLKNWHACNFKPALAQAVQGRPSEEMVKLLLKSGANASFKDECGFSILQSTYSTPLQKLIEQAGGN